MKQYIKDFLKRHMSELHWYKMWNWIDKFLHRESALYCNFSHGNCNPNIKFCIFVHFTINYGPLAAARSLAGDLKMARENGYEPYELYINRKDFLTRNWEKGGLWEHFFEQPTQYSIEEIMNSKHVIAWRVPFNNEFSKYSANFEEYEKRGIAYYENAFRLQNHLIQKFEEQYAIIFEGKERILAVSFREGFSMHAETGNKRAQMHPKSIKIQEAIKIIRNRMEIWNCHWIFVATEYFDTLMMLQKEFKGKVLYYPRTRKSYKEHKKFLGDCNPLIENQDMSVENAEKVDKFLKQNKDFSFDNVEVNTEYLGEVYGLSKCTCLLADMSSAVMAAQIWNRGRFEEIEIFNEEYKGEFY